MNLKRICFLAILLHFTSLQAQDFKTYWNKGYHFDSEDGAYKLKFGGRLQQQWSFFSQDSQMDSLYGKTSDGSEFRRIRLYSAGTIYESVAYKLQFDFAGGSAKIKDAYISLKDLPIVGNFRVGHFKEPFGLDQLNSSNDMTFIERTPSYNFAPGRNNGFLIFNTILKKRATWAVGIYKDTDSFGKSILEDKYNATARVSALPIYNSEKNTLLHVGLAYSYKSLNKNEYGLKSRPEAHLAPTLLNTGTLTDVHDNQLLGVELAFVANAFSAQAEYVQSTVNFNDPLQQQMNFSSSYLEISYFLTGEHRVYSQKAGYFKRVSPKKNFNTSEKTKGAWQVALRYSNSDFSDKSINGGTKGILEGYTAGVSWHLNPATRFDFNYSKSDFHNVGKMDIYQLKFQLTF